MSTETAITHIKDRIADLTKQISETHIKMCEEDNLGAVGDIETAYYWLIDMKEELETVLDLLQGELK